MLEGIWSCFGTYFCDTPLLRAGKPFSHKALGRLFFCIISKLTVIKTIFQHLLLLEGPFYGLFWCTLWYFSLILDKRLVFYKIWHINLS